jgi:hypothetical protein
MWRGESPFVHLPYKIKVMQFNTKEQIVEALVNEFGEKKSSFYNTDTNKQREKYWTFNRTKNFYYKKKGL